jgi:hypothetical protein
MVLVTDCLYFVRSLRHGYAQGDVHDVGRSMSYGYELRWFHVVSEQRELLPHYWVGLALAIEGVSSAGRR